MSATLVEGPVMANAASVWRSNPTLYEINTWVWLSELSGKYAKPVTLRSVPSAEWDAIANFGFDAVWFMGVWERSPAGIAIANQNASLQEGFRRSLPDFVPEDNIGSPYCVRRYVVDSHLGGKEGLAIARRELAKRGMNLVLDFVPNHVAPDHPWVVEYPEYFIQGSLQDARNDPASYLEISGRVYACGRDPYFPAWPDVLQLNAFDPGLREAANDTVSAIARQCDGIRCDMAMLFMNNIFERTWALHSGPRPTTEYWIDLISAIKKSQPGFLFIAEAYWDLEWEIQQQGFDFCYDKKLYDRLEHGGAESVRLHLCADMTYQQKLLRFVENHDEPRAAATFSCGKQEAVAVAIATLPGSRLFHEGQFEGRKARLPVFLARRPAESFDRALHGFYTKLLEAVDRQVFHDGEWALCGRTGWPGNSSYQNLVAWTWLQGEERYLVVINLGDSPAQANVQVPWRDIDGDSLRLVDMLSGVIYERSGHELRSPGLYVGLKAWDYHFFHCVRAKAS